ncbi:uncharacterized protein LOC134819483 isoform X2 [Bolinopsis microptera]|uniref:uncharacterized protein LOC134819483 isoform X2 n=1 Tax=Bolinopsis microptera TaxID=2820187 RepID=UPI00307A30ED
MLHLNSEDNSVSLLSNKTHLTLMFPGQNMEQLEQVIRVNEGEESPNSTPTTPVSASKKRLPSAESDKAQKKVKENETEAAKEEEEDCVPDIDTDDFIACLLLCAVLDPTSPKIRRRREFWRQNRPANSLKLDSKYLSIGVNPTLSQASNSLVSNALAVNAFSTGSLASTALKKSLERISENVSMSMTNRNALNLPQSFRNAASSKGCKNYSQAIGGLRLSAVSPRVADLPWMTQSNLLNSHGTLTSSLSADLSTINPNYHGLNHQYLAAPWHSPNTSTSSFYPSALTASVASEMSGLGSLPYSSAACELGDAKSRGNNQFAGIRGRAKPGTTVPFCTGYGSGGGGGGANSGLISHIGQHGLKPGGDLAGHPAITGQYGTLPNTQY